MNKPIVEDFEGIAEASLAVKLRESTSRFSAVEEFDEFDDGELAEFLISQIEDFAHRLLTQGNALEGFDLLNVKAIEFLPSESYPVVTYDELFAWQFDQPLVTSDD